MNLREPVQRLAPVELVEVQRQRRLLVNRPETAGASFEVEGDVWIEVPSKAHLRGHIVARVFAERLEVRSGDLEAEVKQLPTAEDCRPARFIRGMHFHGRTGGQRNERCPQAR